MLQEVAGLRFGIGACEALLQVTPIHGVYWYDRHQFGKRIGPLWLLYNILCLTWELAIFYSAATLSGVFSGLIAFAAQTNLEIPSKRPAWHWLYIIEGGLL